MYWREEDGLPMLCAGNVPDPSDPDPFSDEKIANGTIPAACVNVSTNGPGFRGGGTTSLHVDGHPAPGEDRYVMHGHVLGPVTRITVEVRGVTHEAAIARSTDREVGTLYGVGLLLDRPLHVSDRVRRTAYLGTKVIDVAVDAPPRSMTDPEVPAR